MNFDNIPVDILKIILKYKYDSKKYDKVMKELILKRELFYDWLVSHGIIKFNFYIYMLVKPCKMHRLRPIQAPTKTQAKLC